MFHFPSYRINIKIGTSVFMVVYKSDGSGGGRQAAPGAD